MFFFYVQTFPGEHRFDFCAECFGKLLASGDKTKRVTAGWLSARFRVRKMRAKLWKHQFIHDQFRDSSVCERVSELPVSVLGCT